MYFHLKSNIEHIFIAWNSLMENLPKITKNSSMTLMASLAMVAMVDSPNSWSYNRYSMKYSGQVRTCAPENNPKLVAQYRGNVCHIAYTRKTWNLVVMVFLTTMIDFVDLCKRAPCKNPELPSQCL